MKGNKVFLLCVLWASILVTAPFIYLHSTENDEAIPAEQKKTAVHEPTKEEVKATPTAKLIRMIAVELNSFTTSGTCAYSSGRSFLYW